MMTEQRIFQFRNWEPSEYPRREQQTGRRSSGASPETIAKAMAKDRLLDGLRRRTHPGHAYAGMYESFRNSFDDYRAVRIQNLRPGTSHDLPPERTIRRLPGYLQHQPYIDDLRGYMANERLRERRRSRNGCSRRSTSSARASTPSRDRSPAAGASSLRWTRSTRASHRAIPEKYLDMLHQRDPTSPEIGDKSATDRCQDYDSTPSSSACA